MGSSQSLISKEDLEAYKELTYFTETEILSCLARFKDLLKTPVNSAEELQQARVDHK